MEEKETREILASTLRFLRELYEQQWELQRSHAAMLWTACELGNVEGKYREKLAVLRSEADAHRVEALQWIDQSIQRLSS